MKLKTLQRKLDKTFYTADIRLREKERVLFDKHYFNSLIEEGLQLREAVAVENYARKICARQIGSKDDPNSIVRESHDLVKFAKLIR